jgi:hypothetical protein
LHQKAGGQTGLADARAANQIIFWALGIKSMVS